MIRVTASENLSKTNVMKLAATIVERNPVRTHEMATERAEELHSIAARSRRGLAAASVQARYLDMLGRWDQLDTTAAAAPALVQVNIGVLVADPTSREALSLLARKLASHLPNTTPVDPFREHSAHDHADGTGPGP